MFLKFFRKFQLKTSVVEFLFNKVAALKARNFIKKKLQHRCFPVNIAKFLRTSFFLQNTSGGYFCIVQVIVLCNVGPSRPRQNCVGYFPTKTLLCAQGQYCTSNFLVQCFTFFSIGVFFHNHSRITGLQGEREGIS